MDATRRGVALAAAGLTFAPKLAAAAAAPQDPLRLDPARLDRTLASMVAEGRTTGVSALIWQGGAERYFAAHGLADREARRPMDRRTLVRIWSMTKPVTGVAMMQLWEQGRFGLDDPVAWTLPEFADMRVYAGKDAGGRPTYRPARRPITIRDLMRHTAGLSYGMRGTPADEAYRAADPLNARLSMDEIGRRLAGLPLMFDPGAEWSYSAAVDLQAVLVARISGQAFDAYVRDSILTPLKMTETGWTQPAERRTRVATTYDYERVRQGAATPPPPEAPAGGHGLISTIDDYMRFARMLLGRGELDGARVLKPSTVRLMATDHLDPRITERFFLPSKGNVGFGLDVAVRTGRPKDAKENRGAVGEFFWDGYASTLFWVDPANDLAAVFLTQKIPFDGDLHRDFRAAVYGPDYLGPKGD